MIITRNSSRAKRGIGAALTALVAVCAAAVFTVEARAESAVSVLCYHSFLEKKKMDPFSFTIDELNSQITQLKKEGFRFVSINDVITGRITGAKNILVTVDDGNKSVYEAHRKVFRPNGIRPLLGIYPNIIINKKHYALTWEQLQELANNGCDIAAHGYFHLKINKKLRDKNPSYFKKEIFLSKKVLEEKLNRKIVAFIYPFGLRDEVTIRALREAGYRYAFTINNGRINIPLTASGDRSFELPRYMVTRTNWKYCFNSVMKNARHRTDYKIAVADEPPAGKADMGALYRAPAERQDPAAELAARLSERKDKTAMAESKGEKNRKLAKNTGAKKKIEKKTGIGSDTRPVPEKQEPEADRGRSAKTASRFIVEENRKFIVPPIQRVESSVKRDILDIDRFSDRSVPGRHASVIAIDEGPVERERGGVSGDTNRRYGPDILAARVPGKTDQPLSKIKGQYHGINAKSIKTYRGVLGMVSGKVERIKHVIRKYVLVNF